MTDEKTNTETRVAFQGERGAFSEDAARQLLGESVETLACRTFDEMFGAVAVGDALCAVAPIENSLAGSVHKNYDLLMEHNLTIIGETNVRIAHNLIALPGVTLAEIRGAQSHPVALAQCEKFFRSHPQVEAVPAYDTAGSVKTVIERGDRRQAAIAGANAAEVYGAEIIARNIEDNPQNFTRFLLLASPDRAGSIKPTGSSERKTSIVFRVANQPGSLFRALAVFSLRDIDMTKIESRPIEGRPWEYSFYLDVAGDRQEPKLERALAHLGEMTESIRVLGSYPRARET
ncbi:MAG TPA: prephenate dehydratase [Blastocatellia bacterium]|nr:prephenate dehydratase [Blastocatellia bacterium]